MLEATEGEDDGDPTVRDEEGEEDDMSTSTGEDDGKPVVKDAEGDDEGDDDKPAVGDNDVVSKATGGNDADASLIKLGQELHDTILSPVHISLTYHVKKSVCGPCRSCCCCVSSSHLSRRLLTSLSLLPRLEYLKMNSF